MSALDNIWKKARNGELSPIEKVIYNSDMSIADKELAAMQLVGIERLENMYKERFLIARNVIERILKSTPHSMCSDAEAWTMAESILELR